MILSFQAAADIPRGFFASAYGDYIPLMGEIIIPIYLLSIIMGSESVIKFDRLRRALDRSLEDAAEYVRD